VLGGVPALPPSRREDLGVEPPSSLGAPRHSSAWRLCKPDCEIRTLRRYFFIYFLNRKFMLGLPHFDRTGPDRVTTDSVCTPRSWSKTSTTTVGGVVRMLASVPQINTALKISISSHVGLNVSSITCTVRRHTSFRHSNNSLFPATERSINRLLYRLIFNVMRSINLRFTYLLTYLIDVTK